MSSDFGMRPTLRSRKGPTPRKPTPREIEGIPGTVEKGYREREIVEQKLPEGLNGIVAERVGLRYFTMGPCNILVGHEPAAKNGEKLWHLTISTPSRHPTWDEIKTARYRLLPLDLTFGMLLPPPDLYVNVEAQDHVFQLWEITDPREPWSAG